MNINKLSKLSKLDAKIIGQVGVCTSTKHGDGTYNVIGFFEKDKTRPSCVLTYSHE